MDKKLFDSINDLVFDTLARRSPLYIDTIGSLVPVPENITTKINGRPRTYPHYRVELRPDERTGTDLRAQILALDGVDKSNLKNVFREWLALSELNTTDSTDFSIKGSVASRAGKIILSDALNDYLNPPYASKPFSRMGSGGKSRIFIIALLAILATFTGISIYSHLSGRGSFLSWFVTSPRDLPEPKRPDPVPAKPAAIVEEPVPATPQPVIEPAPSEVFHIVAGTFANAANAERFCEKIRETYPDAELLRFGNRYYVTVESCGTREETTKAVRRIYPETECWVLHVKDNKIINNE